MDTLQSISGCDSIVKNWTLNIRHNPKMVKVRGGTLRWVYRGSDKNNYRFNWYDCDHDSIIPNETDSVFAPSHNGNYAVIVSIFYCSDTSACYSINDVGLADLNPLQSLTVYPNPVKNRLQISKAEEDGYSLTLLDITGRQLMTADHSNYLDLKSLPAGTYFLKIENGRWSCLKKVIKK